MRTADFIDALVTPATPDRVWQIATNWLAANGFDKVLHLSGTASGQVHARSTLGRDFETFYADSGFQKDDPFVTYCLPSPVPIGTGSDYLADYSYLSKRETAVIKAAAEVGFRAGFSCVTRRDSKGFDAWNVGSSLPRRDVEAIRAERFDELRLGLMALQGRLQNHPDAAHLTIREQQSLELLAEGLRIKAIATRLEIAPVTVELHISNARRKLGAATREQAIAKMIALRMSGNGG